MSYLVAAEIGRLYKPLEAIAAGSRFITATYQTLPGLRAYWPFSSVSYDGQARDIGGGGVVLAPQSSPVFSSGGEICYVVLDGTAYLSSTSPELKVFGTETTVEAGHRGLTLGAWAYFNASAEQMVMSRWSVSAGNLAILLYKGASNNLIFIVSGDGTATSVVTHTATISTGGWYFLCARFVPATTLDVWTNGAKVSNASISSLTSIYNSTETFRVGAYGPLVYGLNGRVSNAFVCGQALTDAQIENLYNATRIYY